MTHRRWVVSEAQKGDCGPRSHLGSGHVTALIAEHWPPSLLLPTATPHPQGATCNTTANVFRTPGTLLPRWDLEEAFSLTLGSL